ncbi:hypothetical protein [Kangiella taiwanensis]|uniref:Uncharacterized protein n=1 Tax=Kangiella taiwanensis TaxID=1079179 RepID=A0ABP8I6U2_9GAMM|nr:hypothetical protein [Kangiella taiwanensis]
MDSLLRTILASILVGGMMFSVVSASDKGAIDLPNADTVQKHVRALLKAASNNFKGIKGDLVRSRERKEIAGGIYPALSEYQSTYSLGKGQAKIEHIKVRDNGYYDYHSYSASHITFNGDDRCSLSCMLEARRKKQAEQTPAKKISDAIDGTYVGNWNKTVKKEQLSVIYEWKECLGKRGKRVLLVDSTKAAGGKIRLKVGNYSKSCP